MTARPHTSGETDLRYLRRSFVRHLAADGRSKRRRVIRVAFAAHARCLGRGSSQGRTPGTLPRPVA